MPGWIVHAYANVPVAANVRLCWVFAEFVTFCGAPATGTNVTLCVRVPNVHVTVPPCSTLSVCGVNVFVVEPAVTAAVVGAPGSGAAGFSLKQAVASSATTATRGDERGMRAHLEQLTGSKLRDRISGVDGPRWRAIPANTSETREYACGLARHRGDDRGPAPSPHLRVYAALPRRALSLGARARRPAHHRGAEPAGLRADADPEHGDELGGRPVDGAVQLHSPLHRKRSAATPDLEHADVL